MVHPIACEGFDVMRIRGLMKIFGAAALSVCLAAGWGCSRDATVDEGPAIDKKPISTEDPNAPQPDVLFPDALRQSDRTLNEFIVKVLDICKRGDYDAFRQLFGTAYQPTPEDQFKRVWYGVKSVEVTRVEVGPQKEPHYYVLATVRLRKPRKGQDERSVPVMVFKESGTWRVGPPSQEAIQALRSLESQPATTPASGPTNP